MRKLKEFELRLLDNRNRAFLIIPIVAGSEEDARIAAREHMQANQASGFNLMPQKASAENQFTTRSDAKVYAEQSGPIAIQKPHRWGDGGAQ